MHLKSTFQATFYLPKTGGFSADHARVASQKLPNNFLIYFLAFFGEGSSNFIAPFLTGCFLLADVFPLRGGFPFDGLVVFPLNFDGETSSGSDSSSDPSSSEPSDPDCD